MLGFFFYLFCLNFLVAIICSTLKSWKDFTEFTDKPIFDPSLFVDYSGINVPLVTVWNVPHELSRFSEANDVTFFCLIDSTLLCESLPNSGESLRKKYYLCLYLSYLFKSNACLHFWPCDSIEQTGVAHEQSHMLSLFFRIVKSANCQGVKNNHIKITSYE